jgi:hypothetical protein
MYFLHHSAFFINQTSSVRIKDIPKMTVYIKYHDITSSPVMMSMLTAVWKMMLTGPAVFHSHAKFSGSAGKPLSAYRKS